MIASPPQSPLYVSDLRKFEKSDLTPEMVIAKNEYVTIFHRSEETIPEAGNRQSTAHEESIDPGQVQVVLLGKPERLCSGEKAYFTKGYCWGRSPTVSIWALYYICLVHSQLQPPVPMLHTSSRKHKGKNSDSTMLSTNIRTIIYWSSLPSIYS